MAELVPAEFDLSTLEHSKRRVAQAFVHGLDKTWRIVPQVPLGEGDREIDMVLVSPTRGAIAVDVKGGRIEVRAGRWYQDGQPLARSPVEQAVTAKHQLVRRLRAMRVPTRLPITHAVAMPDVTEAAAGSGILTGADLAWPAEAIAARQRERRPWSDETVESFVQALRPDLTIANGVAPYHHVLSRRMEVSTDRQLAVAVGLDEHERVLVTGGAGTGKTRLAVRWAERAAARGERVLLTCFNLPLADVLTRELAHLPVTVRAFHEVQPPGRELLPRFDTVIVDEAQDFRAECLAALTHGLDPAGPRRMLVLADPVQSVDVLHWERPPGFVEATLPFNLRNTAAVGTLAERLGGAPPHPGAPAGSAVRHRTATDIRAARQCIREELAGLRGVPPSTIAVLATRSTIRAGLLANPPDGCELARWEHRRAGAVLCETVLRAKGLEATAVLLVALDQDVDTRLLYIGVSRASASLTVIGPRSAAVRLGLPFDG